MSEEYWKEKTEYWRTLLDQKDARIAELEKALREISDEFGYTEAGMMARKALGL